MRNISPVRIAILPLYDIFQTRNLNNENIVVTAGYESGLLEMTLRSLKVPYEILIPEELEWGEEKKDGNWTGLIGMVSRNNADIAFGAIFMTKDRLKVVDYSYPYEFIETVFAARNPEEIHSSSTFIYPFNVYLWITVISTLFCAPIIMKYIYSSRRTFHDCFFHFLGSLFRQPVSVRRCSLSGRIILASVVLGLSFISVSYSSVLLSFLTVPLREEGIKDVKTLTAAVKNQNMKIYALETNTPHILSDHPRQDVRYLMRQIIEKKWILKAEREILFQYIFEKNNALIGSHFLFRKVFGHSNYLVSDDVISTFMVGIIMKKNFKFREKVDKCVHRFNELGIYKKDKDHFLFLKEKYFGEISSDFNSQITLEKLREIFFALLAGYAVSVLTCILEIVHFHLKKQNQRIIF